MIKDYFGKNSTLLIVDDEADLLDLVKEDLMPYFKKVVSAANGVEAIEILKFQKIDIVLTDFLMPEMNGLELIKYMKNSYPLLPVVMLTNSGMNLEVQSAIENGAFDVVDKPYRKNIVLNRLYNALLLPELSTILWTLYCSQVSPDKYEELNRLSNEKKIQLMLSYGQVYKMKNLIG